MSRAASRPSPKATALPKRPPNRAIGRARRWRRTRRLAPISAPKSTTPSTRTAPRRRTRPRRPTALSATSWTGVGGGHDGARGPRPRGLRRRDRCRFATSRPAGSDRACPIRPIGMIAAALIDALDEAGYFSARSRKSPSGSARRRPRRARAAAHADARADRRVRAQPRGCLALQLIERDRFDPAMQALIDNLPALAKRDLPLLRRVCGVDDEDLRDMIAEIHRLDPKPGRAFGDPPAAPAIPDVYVTAAPDLGWRVELNTARLPRVLVNETYAADIKRGASATRTGNISRPICRRELADQEPRAARAHHPQRRDRDRASAGRFPRRGRVGLEAAQPEDGRRRDRRARIRRSRAPPRTNSFRRRAACSR